MKARIRSTMFLLGAASAALCLILTFFLFRGAFDAQARRQVRQTAAAASRMLQQDAGALAVFAVEDVRLALLSPQGGVLIDSGAAGQARDFSVLPEIAQAAAQGSGESVRRRLAEGADEYAYALRLEDGRILYVQMKTDLLYRTMDSALPLVCLAFIAVFLLAALLASRLTGSIVRRIVAVSQNPGEAQAFRELEPVARAFSRQQTESSHSDKLRREFTANVSHELKTPLTSILGYAEMIKTGLARPEDAADFAAKIHKEAQRLIMLISDIIRLGELDELTLDREKENLDLLEAAKNTVEALTLPAAKKNVVISARGEPCLIRANRAMLGELIYNLCDNAIRYNRTGGSVTVQVGEEDRMAVLHVTDTGIGIAREHQARIFERFYRVDKSRSKETGGTGLGLAIVKHIAVHHNAQIIVTSEVGQGTQISVLFWKALESAENAPA